MKSVKVTLNIKVNPAIATDLSIYARFRNRYPNEIMAEALSEVFDILKRMEVLDDLPRCTDKYLECAMASDKSFQRFKKSQGGSAVGSRRVVR
jgi:hypothetical protein